jgi:hypothetical protein
MPPPWNFGSSETGQWDILREHLHTFGSTEERFCAHVICCSSVDGALQGGHGDLSHEFSTEMHDG